MDSIVTLETYQQELVALNKLDVNSVYIKRGEDYFHLCDYMLSSSIEPLTEKWKRRVVNGEQWFPLEEASLYIKPPGSRLYQARQGQAKTKFFAGENNVSIPNPKDGDEVIWQPYMSWHGGAATNVMRGKNHEEGTISIKGYKPADISKGFNEAKESKGEYSHRIAPSVSKDRLAGAAHMVASILGSNSSLSLVKTGKPASGIQLGPFNPNGRCPISPSGKTSVIDMTKYPGAGFVLMFFVHHGAFNAEYAIKPELDAYMLSEPSTVESQHKGSVQCTVAVYLTEGEVLVQEAPLIFWANSIDPSQQMFMALINKL